MDTETARPALAPSYSFPGSSSTSAVARPLKRTLTSACDLEFFKPAESSFNPRPYTPSANPSSSASHSRNKYSQISRQPNRSDTHVIPTACMDPSRTDPNAVFIHPPFADFPGAQNFSEGLTYKVMMDNPNWFLDASDFIRVEENLSSAPASVTASASTLVAYPSHLEPPRGWCPAKKRDLKDAGTEGWPEGEEPRLRCTFCRRTYAGVNAKSMWRRHVFEKHRIAMSNRRDGGDRPRGRGSMKENKPNNNNKSSASSGEETHDSILSIDVAPQTVFQGSQTQHKIRFRPAILGDPMHTRTASASSASESRMASSTDKMTELSSFTPPMTPLKSATAGGSNDVTRTRTPFSSPYDPQATPAFRHSPAPLPSDHPWRYPSPSHPFSKARDLSLSVLLRNSGSLSVDSPSPIPSLMQDDHSSPNSSLVSKKSFFVELNTPESVTNKRFAELKSSASTRRPASANESPLGLIGRTHHRNISDLSLDGARNIFLTSLGDDWDNHSSPVVTRELIDPAAESPVVRRGISLDHGGLGIGLLEPFTLPGNRGRVYESSSDVEDEFEVMDDLTNSQSISDSDHVESNTPPPKKRKTTL